MLSDKMRKETSQTGQATLSVYLWLSRQGGRERNYYREIPVRVFKIHDEWWRLIEDIASKMWHFF